MTILLFAATFILGAVCGWNIYNRLNDNKCPPARMFDDGNPGSRILLLNIAGINFRDDIELYTGRLEVSLIPEPNNPHDPNAIKVIACEDGHHLGYIDKNMTAKVREVTHGRLPRNAWAVIDGREEENTHRRYHIGEIVLKY
jgi:hypothetical protein